MLIVGLEYLEPDPVENLPNSKQSNLDSKSFGHFLGSQKGCAQASKCFRRNKRSRCRPGFRFNASSSTCIGMS